MLREWWAGSRLPVGVSQCRSTQTWWGGILVSGGGARAVQGAAQQPGASSQSQPRDAGVLLTTQTPGSSCSLFLLSVFNYMS